MCLVALGAGPTPCEERRGAGVIEALALRRHVEFLASDALAGRETGEPGVGQAEKYIAQELERAGLGPLPGRSGYWLDFELYREGYDPAATALAIEAGGAPSRGRLGGDFRPLPLSDAGTVEAEVVFAGYGITAPEQDYDDYRGVDVEGKIVLVLRHEPGEQDPTSSFDGRSSTRHALFTTKADNAREHRAAGMLVVTDPLNHGPHDDLRAVGSLRLDKPEGTRGRSAPAGKPFVAAQIGREIASALVAPSGHTLEELQRAVDAGAAPAGFPLAGVRATIGVARAAEPTIVPARNVAAFLEGRDERLRDEWIVVGGHHDHIGGNAGDGDTVFNGADDNASGTSGVLALARAFATRESRPRRSIAFVTFSGEEKGLLGSRALVRQGQLPVDKVVFMLNLDMIGRNPDRPARLFGDGYARGLRQMVEAANAEIGLPVALGGAEYAGNSDHDPFYEKGIPFIFFFTGVHDDYHQPEDHADKLDYGRMESILRLAYGVIERVAEADRAPTFINHIDWLGARLEVLDDLAPARAVLTAVDEGSRGWSAGLRAGDVVTGFAEERPEPRAAGARLHGVEPGTRIALRVRRGTEERVVEIERAKTGYLGIIPGPLEDERRAAHGLHADEGVVLLQVLDGGPADRAGLLKGDILVSIGGRPIDPASLSQRLEWIGAGETLNFTIIRGAERRTIPVTLGERP